MKDQPLIFSLACYEEDADLLKPGMLLRVNRISRMKRKWAKGNVYWQVKLIEVDQGGAPKGKREPKK